ncbi:unnamed protein product [Heterobilharzia americana]|nr:unnamed protein product [Heterobilharzia americana]
MFNLSDQSYPEVNPKMEPIFPGSNPFENNEYPVMTRIVTEPLSTRITTSTIKSMLPNEASNNLLETNKSPSMIFTTSSPPQIKTGSSLKSVTINQSDDLQKSCQQDTNSMKKFSHTSIVTSTSTSQFSTDSISPLTDSKINSEMNIYDTSKHIHPQDNIEENNGNYHQPQQIDLTPTTSSLSTYSCGTFYRYHFMNQLMMNSSLPNCNTNTTYNHSNSNTGGTNSESTSCGLNASWSTPSPPNGGGFSSSSLFNNDIRTVYNGTDELPSQNLISSTDSLRELQSSILNNIQEVNNNHWSNNCDRVDSNTANGCGGVNVDISAYYQSTNQYLHNPHYYTYMHKLNLAGYNLTTPNHQFPLGDVNNNNNNNSFSPDEDQHP